MNSHNGLYTSFLNLSPFFLAVLLCIAAGLGPGCAGPKMNKPAVEDSTYTQYYTGARNAFSQGRLEEAVDYYTLARKRALKTARSDAIANSAVSLAACLIGLGQYDRARPLLTEACLELVRQGLPIADVLLLRAKADYLAGNLADAQGALYQLKTDKRSRPTAGHMIQADFIAGRIACDRQDWCAATAMIEKIQACPTLPTDKLLQARLASLKGHLAMGKSIHGTAARMFEQQVDLLRESRQFRALGPALARAADAHIADNQFDLGADRFYQAARMAEEWGDVNGARRLAQRALDAAVKADNPDIELLSRSILMP
ncbi:outer membrane protein assembly factor BamD [Desulforapulum autotrophicum]|nr:tetratricopeptide repeat protein [Desulforapulum autotrophicum]